MDRRLHALLLSAAIVAGFAAAPGAARAEDPVGATAGDTRRWSSPASSGATSRPPAIDTENFEAGLFVGTISIEDFGSSLLYGGRFAYHFTEDVFAEATLGSARPAGPATRT